MNHKRYIITYDKNIKESKNIKKKEINDIYNNSTITPIVLNEITLSDCQIGGNNVISSEIDTYTTTTTEVGSNINTSSLENTNTDTTNDTSTEETTNTSTDASTDEKTTNTSTEETRNTSTEETTNTSTDETTNTSTNVDDDSSSSSNSSN